MTKPIKPKKLIKVLKKLGFKEIRVKGSHHRFAHFDCRKTAVPVHGNEPIGPGLLNKIVVQDLKIEKKKFFELLKTV